MKKFYGTMNLPKTDLPKFLVEVFKAGYNWIDTAWVYGGNSAVEIKLGKAMKEAKELFPKFKMKIQTKIWVDHYTTLKTQIKKQMKNLGVDKLDAVLLHRPSIDFSKTIKAWKSLVEVKKAKLVGRIGVSNFDKDMIAILKKESKVKPQINQVELSISNFRADRMKYAQDNKIEIQGYSPLGKNIEENLNDPIVKKIAKSHDVKPVIVLTSFLKNFGIQVVTNTTKVERLKELNTYIELTNDDMVYLSTLNKFDNKFEETYPY